MRRVSLAIAGVVALVAASVAVAHGIEGARTASSVAATFSAVGSNITSRTCTTSAGKSITVTDGTYTGTASGNTDLAGAVKLRVRSVINTSDDVGTVSGAFRIDVAGGRDTRGAFTAVYGDGSIAGLAVANAHRPDARIVGNISAAFAPSSGFTSGKIGGGTAGGGAVELGAGSCRPQAPHPEHSAARGTISALSTASITVAGLTCQLPPDRAADINAKFHTGDRVEIRCDYVNGQTTLSHISKR
jgi:hypothetical protein